MHKRTAGFILTGIIATGAGAVAITPASATSSDNAVTSRLASIKSALSSLVSDGTLTKAQADKVASTLDSKLPKTGPGGPGGPGGHFGRFGGMGMREGEDAAAKALGMTTDQLHTAMEGGKSLAAVAKAKGVSVANVVKAMVASAQGKLASAVKDGKMTQAQADKLKTSLTQRFTDRVNDVRPDRGAGGPGHGPRGGELSPPAGGPSGDPAGVPSSTI
ncbi:MAG: hypothetical protein ABI662_11050 [Dermatophilaceae bacterium]